MHADQMTMGIAVCSHSAVTIGSSACSRYWH